MEWDVVSPIFAWIYAPDEDSNLNSKGRSISGYLEAECHQHRRGVGSPVWTTFELSPRKGLKTRRTVLNARDVEPCSVTTCHDIDLQLVNGLRHEAGDTLLYLRNGALS